MTTYFENHWRDPITRWRNVIFLEAWLMPHCLGITFLNFSVGIDWFVSEAE